MAEIVFQGNLFASDFLTDSIRRMPDWQALSDSEVKETEAALKKIFTAFPITQTPNESQTEDDLIWPVLNALGWRASLRQQNLAVKGREDVPDGLLFSDEEAKAKANTFSEEWKRYGVGVALVESKRWARPLDRRSGRRGEETAPSTQMLRYLRRVDDLTTGKLRWGILTNGGRWRLYYQGARSVSEQFFEIDLATILNLPGHNEGLFALDEETRIHWLKIFILTFSQSAFIESPSDKRTFHQRAIEEGEFYEERVANNLSDLVFGNVFPTLAKAIAAASPETPLQDVREAALILLYRLLFILYAEDRDLLPVRDERYDDYGLREKVRGDVGKRKDDNDTFSTSAARYWGAIQDLCIAIDEGDSSIGLPPYNGGLFDKDGTPLLSQIRLGDAIMADVIDALSYEQTPEGRKYINYRDLSVQQLGSIYERLLEHEIIREDGEIIVRPNIFARKGSGSYYTPDDLVGLIIDETIGPLVQACMNAFEDKLSDPGTKKLPEEKQLSILRRYDPAEKLLELKICDPAMGSGHFLVSLVDYLADQVIAAMAEAEVLVDHDYISPLSERIENIRSTILANAEERGWTINEEQLDDRHIIRRMVLKRCVYGVDKNEMAVELAKVSLWLHTFTVGAPLSFLDHHLRTGDSLFGSWVKGGIDKATALGGPLLLHQPVTRALRAASKMQIIEGLTDAEIAEAHRSADVFAEVQEMTAPLNELLRFLHALDWLDIKSKEDKAAVAAWLTGDFGEPLEVAKGDVEIHIPEARPEGSELEKASKAQLKKTTIDPHIIASRFADILKDVRELIHEERFLNWQVAFPGVWSDWENDDLIGGFDALIGNPPWDRIKLQEVEWFAERKREIALAQRASDRKKLVAALEKAGDPLALDYAKANKRAEDAARVARKSKDYPLLSGGDINLYSLFVERAMALVKKNGMIGLLTPSGIASDKTASKFFKGVATEGRLKALYDFENRRTRFGQQPFFPDVDSRFKFCAFVASPSPTADAARCAFFLQDVSELGDPDRRFSLSAEDFAAVNPNTGTAPILKSRRDADLIKSIYGHSRVLIDRSQGTDDKLWPVKYSTMFHMTNDSHLFRTQLELEEKESAYPIGQSRWRSAAGEWLPLYVGRMIHQFDHRAASVDVNEENLHNPALSGTITAEQKADPNFVATPQYWVPESAITLPTELDWALCFRDIARATDARTIIAAIAPKTGFGNKLPLILPDTETDQYRHNAYLILGNINSVIFDFVARAKVHSTSVNWFIFEQLPFIDPKRFSSIKFGKKCAAEVIKEIVLELTYTAHDLAAFATDMGYVDKSGKAKTPFAWDEQRRLQLRAKLDAIFFYLYGITDREDIRYIYSTFPIIERDETNEYGKYLSRDICLAWVNALAAGDPDAKISVH
ncbi:Eco57I restriction-modification methylase domain-containing protein [Hyphococcus sp.]|uniref:Eco57I restriction-modification methylase domain-containing protein n=1 Tax=Hyphococcus sp. TaxID=2038636 RepID=UPI0035C783F3